MVIFYDPGKPFSVLFKWRGTILPLVAKRKDTWFFLLFHIILLVTVRATCVKKPMSTECIDDYPQLKIATILPGTTLLLFFAVFYNGQCFTRYQKMYDWCCAINGGCLSYVALLKCFVDQSRQTNLHNPTRMLLASVYVHYQSMTGSDLSEEEWETIRTQELLFQDELDIVRAYGGKKMILLQKWCLQITKSLLHEEMLAIHVEQALAAGYPDGQRSILGKSPLTPLQGKKGLKKKMTKKQQAKALKATEDESLGYAAGTDDVSSKNPHVSALANLNYDLKVLVQVASNNNNNCLRGATAVQFASLERIILDIKAVASNIVNELNNPLPFPYWHVLNMMMSVNYLLWCYALMKVGTMLTIFLFIVLIAVVSGLREVGTCLADPFGTDDVDFDVGDFLTKVSDYHPSLFWYETVACRRRAW